VRRGRTLALPPIADSGCARQPGMVRSAHHDEDQGRPTPADALCRGGTGSDYLSAGLSPGSTRFITLMWYAVLADAVALVHFLFVLFVVAGSLLALRWPRAAWFHAPALIWALFVECAGTLCPLTPLENRLRVLGGESGYNDDFVSYWLLSLLYPASITRSLQMTLGGSLFLLNVCLYTWIWTKRRPKPVSLSTRTGKIAT
jgi:hypothetical protein